MQSTSIRMQQLGTYFFAELDARIKSLQANDADIIRLDVGSPDLMPPPLAIETLRERAGDANAHRYQPHNGTVSLREAWANYYQNCFQLEFDPEMQILPLMGSKEGIFNLIQAFVDPGDVVLIPDPGYPAYTRGTRFAGGEPCFLPLLPENDFRFDLNGIPAEVARRAKLLWLNYPNNPTGGTASLDFFEEVIAFAHEYEFLVCHDAAYAQVSYDGVFPPSILQVPGAEEVAVEFNSLSKTFHMAGWRTGALVGNQDAIQTLSRLKTNVDSGHFRPILEAAAACLEELDKEWIAERNAILQRRRDVVVDGLENLGIPVQSPQGALYIWCPVPPGQRSGAFVLRLLEEAHVSFAPGTVFGAQGEGYMRISLTASEEQLHEAIDRMGKIYI
ncbi:MAG: aminotransferase class I/II-fold pyridoxal phosphate-dependent enzyme [Anaerolineales bacterium]|nr:aminotransferase class I/II-fold pyridoxal phosphate-dependent enzyme [Anaerolineales bacterium]